jgi:hypothetical protein
VGEVIDDAEGGFAGEGDSFREGVAGAEVRVVVEEAAIFSAEIEVVAEVQVDA